MVIAGNLPKINQELGQAHTLLMLDINEHLYQSRKVTLLHLSVQQLTFQDASSSRELFHCYAFSLTYVSARTYTKGKKNYEGLVSLYSGYRLEESNPYKQLLRQNAYSTTSEKTETAS